MSFGHCVQSPAPTPAPRAHEEQVDALCESLRLFCGSVGASNPQKLSEAFMDPLAYAVPRGRRVGCAASTAAEGATAASGGLLRIGAEGQLTSTAPPSSTPAFSTAAGCAS